MSTLLIRAWRLQSREHEGLRAWQYISADPRLLEHGNRIVVARVLYYLYDQFAK